MILKSRTCLAMISGLLLMLSGSVKGLERPNVIVILVDDMGFSDIGP